MRVLVCGGRDFDNEALMKFGFLLLTSDGETITEMCHGGAKGADTLAGKYAEEHNIPCKVYPADWEKHGKKAGFIRNHEMLISFDPDVVFAFPGGKGTAHMIRIAEAADYTVVQLSKGFTDD